MLALKKLSPTRLVRNDFYRTIEEAENRGASGDELLKIIGIGRSKLGIFEGDTSQGELEIGQISSFIRDLPTSAEIIDRIIAEYNTAIGELRPL